MKFNSHKRAGKASKNRFVLHGNQMNKSGAQRDVTKNANQMNARKMAKMGKRRPLALDQHRLEHKPHDTTIKGPWLHREETGQQRLEVHTHEDPNQMKFTIPDWSPRNRNIVEQVVQRTSLGKGEVLHELKQRSMREDDSHEIEMID